MKLVSSFVTSLLNRIGRLTRALKASTAEWPLRPAPALVPIPVRADRLAGVAAAHRWRRGL